MGKETQCVYIFKAKSCGVYQESKWKMKIMGCFSQFSYCKCAYKYVTTKRKKSKKKIWNNLWHRTIIILGHFAIKSHSFKFISHRKVFVIAFTEFHIQVNLGESFVCTSAFSRSLKYLNYHLDEKQAKSWTSSILSKCF